MNLFVKRHFVDLGCCVGGCVIGCIDLRRPSIINPRTYSLAVACRSFRTKGREHLADKGIQLLSDIYKTRLIHPPNLPATTPKTVATQQHNKVLLAPGWHRLAPDLLPGILPGMTVTERPHVKPIGTTRFVKRLINKYWYPFISRRLDEENVVFLNYGYEEDPPMGLPLEASDEPNRFCIQLYHRTASQADLSGKQVLEISCGHGGGASYLVRTLRPASYTALDFNADGIAYCRKRHNLPGLDFVHGNAESLPLPDESFDVVINVEASHAYLRFPRFLAEVARVLRPGGHFLYADFRGYLVFSDWAAALADAPMRPLSERVINAEVLRGMEKNSTRYLELIGYLPAFMRSFGRLFAGLPGTRNYRELERGRISYRIYSFTKD